MDLTAISLLLLIPLYLYDRAMAKMSNDTSGRYNYSLLPIIIILSLIILIQTIYAGSTWYFKPLLYGKYLYVYLWYEAPLLIVIGAWPIFKLVVEDVIKYGFIKQLDAYVAGIRDKIVTGLVELGLGLLFLLIYAMIMIGVESILSIQGGPVREADFRDTLMTLSDSTLFSALLIFDDIILFPLAEEFLFRGYCYNAFKERLGKNKGIIISALIFSLYHNDLSMIMPNIILGVMLARGYERTKSLITPFTMHALYNVIFSYAAKLLDH